MSNVEIGRTGAKRISVEQSNPRALLLELIDRFPHDEEKCMLRHFQEAVKDDPDMLDVVIGYAFANHWEAIHNPKKNHSIQNKKSFIKHSAQLRIGIQRVIKEKAQEMLMEMAMPNGKRLGDCTISYVSRLGGWLSKIVEGKNPRQTVEHVYDEDQLREMRRAA